MRVAWLEEGRVWGFGRRVEGEIWMRRVVARVRARRERRM